MKPRRYRIFDSESVLCAVQAWAGGCTVLREFTLHDRGSRIDAVIVPDTPGGVFDMTAKARKWGDFWDTRQGLIGVEIKVSRSDFLAGLKKGQFERYNGLLAGVFIATTLDVCKTAEIPPELGHLLCYHDENGLVCVCRRKPKFSAVELPNELLWKVLHRQKEAFREERHRHQCEILRIREAAGARVAQIVGKLLAPAFDDGR